jgi:hypothetical protein
MEDRAFEDFNLKLDYMESMYERLLTRFHYFLTVEIALFGFLGWLVFEKNNVAAVRVPALLGALVSLLWYIVAAGDQALVKEYRNRAERSAKRLGEFATDHAAKEMESPRWNGFMSWFWRPLSWTRMAVNVAWITLILWLLLLAFGPAWLESFLPPPKA